MADYRLPFTGEQVEEILATATPQSSLTQETQRATEAEGQLQSNINQEAETRGNADLQLQQNINAEAETRGQADLALQQLIQQVQASLINYYLKTETYSATQIDAMLAAIKQFRYQVVDVLPTPSADTMGIIYLVPSAHAVSGNIKDEYITLTRDEGSGTIYYFEQIGETAIDLSNYYTKAQTNAEITAAINAALAAYYTSTQTDAAIAAAIATAIANYYTKSQVDALIANFITASVNNLVNYYLKSETFTKAEVNQLIAAVQQFTYQSVAELPTASADTMNKIYLVPSTNPETKNVKDEFITIAVTDQGTTTYSWEQIGTTTVDLSGYYTSQQTDAAISNALNTALASYSTTSQMTAAIATAIANYYTKAEVDALIANFITKSVNDLVNYYLKSDTYTKAEVQQLIDAVKQFRYQLADSLPTASISTMGIIYLIPSTNPQTSNAKDEFITIEVVNGGQTTYQWEQIGTTTIDLSGYYTAQQTDAAITNALNTALANYATSSQMTDAVNRILFLERGLGKYDTTRNITLQQATAGKYVNVNGQEVSASGYGISAEVQLNAGDIMLVPSASAVPADVSLFARIVTRTYDKVITYAYTYRQDYPQLPLTATADYNPALIYTAQYDESGDTPVLTGWLMGGQTYTTLPATRTVTESYYEPLMKQAVAAMPSTGYYVYLCPTSMTVVVSGYTATVNGGVAMVVGLGIFKNIATNFIGAPGQAVIAQAFAQLVGEIAGLKAQLDNLGETRAVCINSEDVPKVQNYPMIIYGSGAPTAPNVPAFIGHKYLDTTNKKEYTAFSVTNSISDWVLIN